MMTDDEVKECLEDFETYIRGVPSHIQQGLRFFLLDGIIPGSFLLSILENDFVTAAKRADAINLTNLGNIALFMSDGLPEACWGSIEKVNAWVQHRGLKLSKRT